MRPTEAVAAPFASAAEQSPSAFQAPLGHASSEMQARTRRPSLETTTDSAEHRALIQAAQQPQP